MYRHLDRTTPAQTGSCGAAAMPPRQARSHRGRPASRDHALSAFPLALALALTIAPPAWAQYAGPSTVQSSTVRALLDSGKDDQRALLRGRIVSHDGGEHYTFEDDTGRIKVEVDQRHFPAGERIDDKRMVEVSGELDRDRDGIEFEVDSLRPL